MPQIPNDLGWGGSHENQLRELLAAAVDDINSLKAQLDDLQTKYNNHIQNGEHQVATSANAAAPTSDVSSNLTLTK